ncbi:hypothetical protein EMCRGX_G009405 [Ephydatia muelleri]
MAYLAAITAETGVPLFLSFPVVGSLNGVHLFASNLKTSLLSCTNDGVKVVWKCFYQSITLILVMTDDSPVETHLLHLLDMVFNALVLLVGLQELESVQNVERLKKDLKCCYPLIDSLLLQGTHLMYPLTQSVDVLAVAVEDFSTLSQCMDAFSEAVHSGYGCVSVNGKIIVATESWWKLSSLEIGLLAHLIASLPPPAVRISQYTSPGPATRRAQDEVGVYWSGLTERLVRCARNTSCVPAGVELSSSLLAFCLVNLKSRRCVSSLKPSTFSGDFSNNTLSAGFQGELSTEERHRCLVEIYKTVADNMLPSQVKDGLRQETAATDSVQPRPPEEVSPVNGRLLRASVPHRIAESYICTKKYKAYTLHQDGYNLFVLLDPNTPTFALRKATMDVYKTLTGNTEVGEAMGGALVN